MHVHCELLIPPTQDVEGAVAAVMERFGENRSDEDGCEFWDFYVIGGRFAGNKLIAKYDPEKVEAFCAWLKAKKVTVSGLQCGKQELSPPSQAVVVDAKWNEMFPCDPPIPCPFFAHSNDQYGKDGDGTLPGDIVRLGDVPARLRVGRVVIAGRSFDSDSDDFTGPLEAKFMLCEEEWNGCNHMSIQWDKSVAGAVEQYRESLARCKPEYAAKAMPTDDWLAVTVDYHS